MTINASLLNCCGSRASALRFLFVATLFGALSSAVASDPRVAHALQPLGAGQHQTSCELLEPREAESWVSAESDPRLGRSEIGIHSEAATASSERNLAAAPTGIDAHLEKGRADLARGDYARAKIEFEYVLRFDDLPADLHQQVEIYARAAKAYAEGSRLLGSGYAIAGLGNYRTSSVGGGPNDDDFYSARVGGSLNYQLDGGYALNGSLDYRYRNYHQNNDRRDDSDLR